jgi:hypothetical protein
MGKKIAALIGLLLLGFFGAVLIWILVYLPFRVVQAVDFVPLRLTEETARVLDEKIDALRADRAERVRLSREEIALLLKRGLERDLGIEVTALAVDLGRETVTVIVQVRISDIPSPGYLTWLLTRRSVEYTTTYVSARVRAEQGKIAYELLDFRIGSFSIPRLIRRRILGRGMRPVEGIPLQRVEIGDDAVLVVRSPSSR